MLSQICGCVSTPTQSFINVRPWKDEKTSFVWAALSHFSHCAVCAGPWQLLTLSGRLVWFLEQLSLESYNNTLGKSGESPVQNRNCFCIARSDGWPGKDYFIAEWCQVQSPVKCPWARHKAFSFSLPSLLHHVVKQLCKHSIYQHSSLCVA